MGKRILSSLKSLAAEEASLVSAADVSSVESAYESWWADEKGDIEPSYSDCIKPETLPMVIHHLVAAAPY